MSKVGKKSDGSQSPEDLVQIFAACSNFPRDRAGVLALAQALARASSDFRVPMKEIIQQCADISTYCPVPREIRNVAIGIRDEIRSKAEENKRAQWERIYGPPDPDWPAKMMGILVSAPSAEQLRALHIRAIRDMLYYTEGEGIGMGDRPFWDGNHSNYGARNFDLDHYPELVAQVRKAGGWRTERELQMDWIDL